eukprot:Ihof_evm4s128 gene=Ihof_evmTU4s128
MARLLGRRRGPAEDLGEEGEGEAPPISSSEDSGTESEVEGQDDAGFENSESEEESEGGDDEERKEKTAKETSQVEEEKTGVVSAPEEKESTSEVEEEEHVKLSKKEDTIEEEDTVEEDGVSVSGQERGGEGSQLDTSEQSEKEGEDGDTQSEEEKSESDEDQSGNGSEGEGEQEAKVDPNVVPKIGRFYMHDDRMAGRGRGRGRRLKNVDNARSDMIRWEHDMFDASQSPTPGPRKPQRYATNNNGFLHDHPALSLDDNAPGEEGMGNNNRHTGSENYPNVNIVGGGPHTKKHEGRRRERGRGKGKAIEGRGKDEHQVTLDTGKVASQEAVVSVDLDPQASALIPVPQNAEEEGYALPTSAAGLLIGGKSHMGRGRPVNIEQRQLHNTIIGPQEVPPQTKQERKARQKVKNTAGDNDSKPSGRGKQKGKGSQKPPPAHPSGSNTANPADSIAFNGEARKNGKHAAVPPTEWVNHSTGLRPQEIAVPKTAPPPGKDLGAMAQGVVDQNHTLLAEPTEGMQPIPLSQQDGSGSAGNDWAPHEGQEFTGQYVTMPGVMDGVPMYVQQISPSYPHAVHGQFPSNLQRLAGQSSQGYARSDMGPSYHVYPDFTGQPQWFEGPMLVPQPWSTGTNMGPALQAAPMRSMGGRGGMGLLTNPSGGYIEEGVNYQEMEGGEGGRWQDWAGEVESWDQSMQDQWGNKVYPLNQSNPTIYMTLPPTQQQAGGSKRYSSRYRQHTANQGGATGAQSQSQAQEPVKGSPSHPAAQSKAGGQRGGRGRKGQGGAPVYMQQTTSPQYPRAGFQGPAQSQYYVPQPPPQSRATGSLPLSSHQPALRLPINTGHLTGTGGQDARGSHQDPTTSLDQATGIPYAGGQAAYMYAPPPPAVPYEVGAHMVYEPTSGQYLTMTAPPPFVLQSQSPVFIPAQPLVQPGGLHQYPLAQQ